MSGFLYLLYTTAPWLYTWLLRGLCKAVPTSSGRSAPGRFAAVALPGGQAQLATVWWICWGLSFGRVHFFVWSWPYNLSCGALEFVWGIVP